MALALICIGFVTVMWDIRLRISYSCYGREDFRRFNRVQQKGLRTLIAIVKIYADFRVIVEKAIAGKLPRQFMVLSNHQSLADIPVLAYVFSPRIVGFVAKSELARGLPSFSFALRKGKHALISRRGEFSSAHKELIKLAKYSREDVCPTVFPEGTRSRTGRVGSFHSAAVRTILNKVSMPVLSVALDGGLRIARIRGLLTNLRNCRYRVKFLSLYPPTNDRAEIRDIVRKSHEEISRQVKLWRSNQK